MRLSGAFSKMRRLIRIYRAGLSRELSATAAYRGSLAIWMFGVVVAPYVSLTVWLAVLGDQEAIGPYGRAQLVQYYLSVSLVAMLTGAWAAHFIPEDIRRGGLNQHLLRPWSYLHHYIINNIGEKLSKLVILGPMILIVALGFRQDLRLGLSWAGALLLPCSILMGAAIALLINVCVGLIAFWTSDTTGIKAFYLFLEALLSGQTIPLNLFPADWQGPLRLAPFRYTLSLPVEIITGTLEGRELAFGLGMQVVWLALAYVAYRAMWRAGIRTYGAVGG